MDNVDVKILELLKQDGRMSYSDIAEEVHLSRVAVRDRISRLKENGIIKGFVVVIDARAYNKNASLFMDIEVEPRFINSVAKKLVLLPEIAVVSQHSGTSGLHVHAFISAIGDISDYLESNIYHIEGVKAVHTDVLLHQYKTNPYMA